MAARVTLQTVADRVGVSRMTVSNAFSRPDQLSPALRERILAAAEDLGYSGPDPTARALARGSTGAVGVLLTDSLQAAFEDEVAIRLLASLAAGLAPTGLALTLLTASDGPVLPARELPMDGAVVYSCMPRSRSLDQLVRRRLPLVFVDQAPHPPHPSVNVDDRGGGRAAARHLVDLGHRRVAVLTARVTGPYGLLTDRSGLDDAHVARERVRGAFDVLHEVGVDPPVMVAPFVPESSAVDALLDLPERPTGVLCFSDRMALTLVEAARRRGLEVPRDLSVVGFDDSSVAALATPGLTTIAQDVDAKGRAAAAALVAEMDARRSGTQAPELSVLLPTSLVVRGSTAPPAAD